MTSCTNNCIETLKELSTEAHLPESRQIASALLCITGELAQKAKRLQLEIESVEQSAEQLSEEQSSLSDEVRQMNVSVEALKECGFSAIAQQPARQQADEAAMQELQRLSETASHPDVRRSNAAVITLLMSVLSENRQLKDRNMYLSGRLIELQFEWQQHMEFWSNDIDRLKSDLSRAMAMLNLEG